MPVLAILADGQRPLSRWRLRVFLRLCPHQDRICHRPWYGGLAKGLLYGAGEFLGVASYTNVQRWADEIAARPAVKRGRIVNRLSGELSQQLHERHDAADFSTRTQDKLAPTP
jgi:hypothetical protein